eukprot:TRINITY_DN19058_c0_g1_i1.p1 TRINITY_DN19058_c0_g1~~TRINITY_DN19058_c0_g1_i1.p1  ORF type:complete len:103 (+),score=4.26 TRINITY_DN19058_c0_g1_i1:32-310(+)
MKHDFTFDACLTQIVISVSRRMYKDNDLGCNYRGEQFLSPLIMIAIIEMRSHKRDSPVIILTVIHIFWKKLTNRLQHKVVIKRRIDFMQHLI